MSDQSTARRHCSSVSIEIDARTVTIAMTFDSAYGAIEVYERTLASAYRGSLGLHVETGASQHEH